MDLQVFLHLHKLLHIILPVIVILLFYKKIGLTRICVALLIIGLFKEAYDMVVQTDPLWISIVDYVLTSFGIALGTFIVKTHK